MELDLSPAQIRKAKKGLTFQLSPSQIGIGSRFNLHPVNMKKVETALRLGKGVRLTLSEGELGFQEGAGVFKKLKKSANKAINRNLKKAENLAKKHITEKNVAKYALKGYNKLNEELKNRNMDTVHGAILNEGLGYVPFVPQDIKDRAGAYARDVIDKKLEEETRRIGAGFGKTAKRFVKKNLTKKNLSRALDKGNQIARDLGYENDIQTMVAKKVAPRNKSLQNVLKNEANELLGSGVNPYLPTGLISGSGFRPITSGKARVFSDQHNVLRKGQAGFAGKSRMESEKKLINGGSFKHSGGRFKHSGGSFKHSGGHLKGKSRQEAEYDAIYRRR
jgi:hypothetical protein